MQTATPPQSPSNEPLIDAEELGRRLQLETKTIWGMARNGRIPVVRISRRAVRFRYSDVLRAFEQAKSA